MNNQTGSTWAVVAGALIALVVCHAVTGFTIYDRENGISHRQMILLGVGVAGAVVSLAGSRLFAFRKRD